jgi:multidrug efflux pump
MDLARLSALGRTKGSMVAVNLVANTDLRTVHEFRQLVVKEQDRVFVPLGMAVATARGVERDVQEACKRLTQCAGAL